MVKTANTNSNIPGKMCENEPGARRKCRHCNVDFTNRACFDHHLRNRVCGKRFFCAKCNYYYDATSGGQQAHMCDRRFCHTCMGMQPIKHNCIFAPAFDKPAARYKTQRYTFSNLDENGIWHDGKVVEDVVDFLLFEKHDKKQEKKS
ncbi:unnamed protein product, partial [Mesorhabditis spiculigera]